MTEIEPYIRRLQEVVDLRFSTINCDHTFDDYNRMALDSFVALQGIGVVIAAYPRSPRMADHHTLPRDYVKTTILETQEGEVYEIPEKKPLIMVAAPHVTTEGVASFLSFGEGDNRFTVVRTFHQYVTPILSFRNKDL